MTRAQFIRANRTAIDAYIRRACPNVGALNDRDRGQWIDNNELLHTWARAERRRPVSRDTETRAARRTFYRMY